MYFSVCRMFSLFGYLIRVSGIQSVYVFFWVSLCVFDRDVNCDVRVFVFAQPACVIRFVFKLFMSFCVCSNCSCHSVCVQTVHVILYVFKLFMSFHVCSKCSCHSICVQNVRVIRCYFCLSCVSCLCVFVVVFTSGYTHAWFFAWCLNWIEPILEKNVCYGLDVLKSI